MKKSSNDCPYAPNRFVNIIKYSYDFSSNVSHMFFAGALIQYPPHLYNRNAPYLNIGQWRYLSRALHRFLEVKYEQRTWPSIRKIPAHASGIVDRIKYRIQQAAGLYQMYTNHEEVINRNINNGLADLITDRIFVPNTFFDLALSSSCNRSGIGFNICTPSVSSANPLSTFKNGATFFTSQR